MNYFAHAYPFLDYPYFAAGTGVPDWLTVVDRSVRVRLRHAEPFVDDPCPHTAALARGIIQHVRDDIRFHEAGTFVELSLELSAMFRGVLSDQSGFGPAFLGHLLAEVLLDASLIAENPARLGEYYRVIHAVDPATVEEAVNRIAHRRTTRLALMISRFLDERILWDYLDDAKLLARLNQVMRRVKLPRLSEGVLDLLPEARRKVYSRKAELLAGVPTEPFAPRH